MCRDNLGRFAPEPWLDRWYRRAYAAGERLQAAINDAYANVPGWRERGAVARRRVVALLAEIEREYPEVLE